MEGLAPSFICCAQDTVGFKHPMSIQLQGCTCIYSRRAVVSYWRKYVHKVLVSRLGGLSLPWKSVVRLTDRPDMTLDVYRGRKTTLQQQHVFISPCLNFTHKVKR